MRIALISLLVVEHRIWDGPWSPRTSAREKYFQSRPCTSSRARSSLEREKRHDGGEEWIHEVGVGLELQGRRPGPVLVLGGEKVADQLRAPFVGGPGCHGCPQYVRGRVSSGGRGAEEHFHGRRRPDVRQPVETQRQYGEGALKRVGVSPSEGAMVETASVAAPQEPGPCRDRLTLFLAVWLRRQTDHYSRCHVDG